VKAKATCRFFWHPEEQQKSRCRRFCASTRTNMSGETLDVDGADWCPYCIKAKQLLQRAQSQQWRAVYIDAGNKGSASKAATQAGHRAQLDRIETIPAVFVGAR
jgi:glutaredoxin